MRDAKIRVQQRKALSKATRHRQRPQDKHLSKSWRTRNEARSKLQQQYQNTRIPNRVKGDAAR